MQTELRLFLKWGIEPTTDYEVAEQANRVVQYADKKELEEKLTEAIPAEGARTRAERLHSILGTAENENRRCGWI